mgnify:FL=1
MLTKQMKKDIILLKLVGDYSIDKVAEDLSRDERKQITDAAIRGRLYRLRKRIQQYQQFLNNVRSLQKENPRIRKFSTSGALKEEMIE